MFGQGFEQHILFKDSCIRRFLSSSKRACLSCGVSIVSDFLRIRIWKLRTEKYLASESCQKASSRILCHSSDVELVWCDKLNARTFDGDKCDLFYHSVFDFSLCSNVMDEHPKGIVWILYCGFCHSFLDRSRRWFGWRNIFSRFECRTFSLTFRWWRRRLKRLPSSEDCGCLFEGETRVRTVWIWAFVLSLGLEVGRNPERSTDGRACASSSESIDRVGLDFLRGEPPPCILVIFDTKSSILCAGRIAISLALPSPR